jgi:hypothetical protein
MAAASRRIAPAVECQHERASRCIAAEHAEALRSRGLAVVDGFLDASELAAIHAELQHVAFGHNRQREEIRTDKVKWVDEAECGALPALLEAVRSLKGLAHALHECGSHSDLEVPPRCMLSSYAGAGSQYRSHRDNVGGSFMTDEGGWLADREQADREVTAILYLNRAGAQQRPPISNAPRTSHQVRLLSRAPD